MKRLLMFLLLLSTTRGGDGVCPPNNKPLVEFKSVVLIPHVTNECTLEASNLIAGKTYRLDGNQLGLEDPLNWAVGLQTFVATNNIQEIIQQSGAEQAFFRLVLIDP